MSKIHFRKVKLSKQNKERLEMINDIIEEYQAQGYRLTLRQLYYQLVSRDVIPNKVTEYSKLSTLLKEGRIGGIVDWDAIEDRLRRPSLPYYVAGIEDALEDTINQYRLDRMKGQDTYLEVWVEKDALSGVLKRVTQKFHIPIVVNRGYSSASAMFDAFQRFKKADRNEQRVRVIYLGDYDPSGVDMIRDIYDRTVEFIEGKELDIDFQIEPIALTREQIDHYNPPPNPAKRTDPRAKGFIEAHGSTSWEVDALKPEVLNTILENAILKYIDLPLYNEVLKQEEEDKQKLEGIKDQFLED